MRGVHIRQRPWGAYSAVINVGDQPARRCQQCNGRVWVDDHGGNRCAKKGCDGQLGDVQQERRQVWLNGHATRKEAEDAALDFVHEWRHGGRPWQQDTPLREYAEAFLDQHASRVRPRTILRYRSLAVRHILPVIGDVPVGEVRPAHVRQVLNVMTSNGLAPRTVRQARAVLGLVMSQAVEDELAVRNPVQSARGPSVQRPDLTVLLPEHISALQAEVVGTKWETPLALAAWTGMRRSEVLALRWSDLDLDGDRPVLTVRRSLQLVPEPKPGEPELEFLDTKSESSRRTVRLAPTIVERLRRHRVEQNTRRLAAGAGWSDGDLVSDDGDGRPMHPDAMTAAFRRHAKAACLPDGARLHDLRHAVVTLLALEGVPMEVASNMLGHHSPAFTASVYGHIVDSMTDGAADAIERALGTVAGG